MDTQQNIEDVSSQIEDVPAPLVINPSTASEHTKSGVRDLLIFIGGFTAVMGFISKRDLAGFLSWIHSSEAFPFLGLVVAGSGLAWRHLRIKRKKAELVAVGLSAPNSSAVVLGIDIEKTR